MYAPGGFGGSELGDVEVVPDGETLHLFHLTLPSHDVVGHAVSSDGLTWRPRAPALTTGPPGAADDDMIWTVSVTRGGHGWHMLYTALALADAGRVQRVAHAVSSDLDAWQKRGVVAEADPRWYETDRSTAPWVAFRDPKPVWADGAWRASVCARARVGPAHLRGVVGLLASPDLSRWSVEPPLFAPASHYELECPQVFALGGRWYLTAAVMEDRSQRYWVADAFGGPYRAPPDNRLGPPGHYAARMCRWRGQDLLFAIHGPRPHRLLSPLVLEAEPDGALLCRPWSGWDAYRVGSGVELAGDVDAPGGRREVDLGPAPAGYRLAGHLALDAHAGGLGFGVADDGGGYWVELVPGEHRVRLVRGGPGPDGSGRPWFDRAVLAESVWSPNGSETPFALRVVAGEIEVALAGRVRLAAFVEPSVGARLTVFAESGRARLKGGALTPLAVPG